MANHYNVEVTEYSGDCETCGYWSGRRIKAWYKGGVVVELDGDDHLSEQPAPELSDVLIAILEREGIYVTIDVNEDPNNW